MKGLYEQKGVFSLGGLSLRGRFVIRYSGDIKKLSLSHGLLVLFPDSVL